MGVYVRHTVLLLAGHVSIAQGILKARPKPMINSTLQSKISCLEMTLTN